MPFRPKYTHQAWVLGMFESGLTAVRSLGRLGIPVVSLDWDPHMPGCYSRYGHFRQAPSPVEAPQALLDWFLVEGKKLSEPAVILPATDAYVAFISRYRSELLPYFLFALPPANVTDALLDKYLSGQMAEEKREKTLPAVLIDSDADLKSISANLRYPILIKAQQTYTWKLQFKEKGFQVNNPEEFSVICEKVIRSGLSAVAQEILNGPITNHFEVNFYRSVHPGHPILAIFPVRKIRQFPSKFGSGSMLESHANPEVIERTLGFAEQIDFQGIGNIEYIFDNDSGEYYLVELNARLWQQNVQADHCGINFPLIAYRDLLGEKQAPCLECKPGVKWMDVISDFQAFWEENRNGSLQFSSWLKSLKGTEVFATFARDDWKPVLHEFEYGFKFIKFPLYVMRHWKNNDF